ncbi:MAG TPA: prephenate dehydrogenase/arogenate dehydrogenase family protein [Burkholderiales bacterium]|nr:prephenate dehydrogenase/arogenate dehydrogenase family protein [Burkholderiales bacterium]
MTDVRFRRLAVFGVGLIGGSFAMALKQAGCVERVAGVGRSRANLERALELGAIDEIAPDTPVALEGADLVLVAVPVQQTASVLAAIAPHLQAGAVLTDGGSTKRDVVAAARGNLGVKLMQFVPAHPVAGAELSGVDAASAELFRDRSVVLTPVAETGDDARVRVDAAWRACGARTVEMSAERHDQVFAAVSHLPHALAFTLVEMIASRPDAAELFSCAGAGFRDFTRIAGSSPEMWRDICLANGDALLAEIRAFQARLATLAAEIETGDGADIELSFELARAARSKWVRSRS